MLIPPTKLDPDIFARILEDIVTREGTDYGEREIPVTIKIEQLKNAVLQEQCFLVFDELTESIGVVTREQAELLHLR